MRNCACILGTNALTSLGFSVTHIDGTVVSPVESGPEANQEKLFCVSLQQSLRLGPYQTRTTKVRLSADVTISTMQTGMLSPSEELVREKLCDFPDELWDGNKVFSVPLTNWTQEPVVLEKGTIVERTEEVSLIDGQDSVWTETSSSHTVNYSQATCVKQGRRAKLLGQLDVVLKSTSCLLLNVCCH